MQLVVQYLTKTAIKLPSAGDNTRSSIQHPLYCPWCTGHGGVTVVHSRVNDSVDERGQRARVQRPPDTPELTKSVKAARADTSDVTIDALIQGNVQDTLN